LQPTKEIAARPIPALNVQGKRVFKPLTGGEADGGERGPVCSYEGMSRPKGPKCPKFSKYFLHNILIIRQILAFTSERRCP
jgi:hypothetical protein